MLKKLQISGQEKGELFHNEKLEKYTRTSPQLAVFFYGGIWAVLLYLNFALGGLGFWASVGVYLFALLFWSLFEYLAHRYLFHFVNENPRIQKFHRMIHGIHHEFPRDTDRLIMPPLPGAAIICLLLGCYYLLLGDTAYIFMAGFINGWAIYVSIHYIIHAYQPVPGFKILWTHHAKHHYKEGDKAFGVSSVLWDKIFGTMPD